ncbi:type II secretion system protein [Desulfovibrio sp. JC022]|nr:type II secretion system protein [Desulfovibrio sp. JC022]
MAGFSQMKQVSGQGGFTFLEVMAAIVVISVMSLTAVQLVKNTSDEFIKVKASRHAYELAQKKLYQIVADEELASYDGSSGVFDGDDDNYTWTSETLVSSTEGVRVLKVKVQEEQINVSAVMDYMYFSK